MKRFLALAMALCIVLGMVACSSNTNNGSEETAANNSTSATIETDIAHDAEARLLREVRRLTTSIVHAGPVGAGPTGRSRATTR